MTDNELCRLLKDSPEAGQRAFYDKYFNYVYTIVFSRLKGSASREDVDECVGDVFAHCFFYFDKQSEISGSLKAFAATVARRKSIDTYRSVIRHSSRNISIDDAGEISSEENLTEAAENTELRRIIYKKLGELGEPDSTIVIQKYYYGRSSKEIAHIVDLSADNVRVRCSRAVRKLKAILVESGITR